MMNNIVDYLNELFPNPRCELNYNKDYELLIAVMLSAQTTDKNVNKVTSILFNKYKTLKELSCADIEDIKKIIMPIGTYNKKSANIINISKSLIENYNGVVPNNREYLESLPGVGRKTVNVVLSNLFDENYIAIDTHVSRVSKRLGLAEYSDDVFAVEKKLDEYFKNQNLGKIHHQLVLFGRYYCKSRNPLCDSCKLKKICKKRIE